MILTYLSNLRTETSPEVIATLLRKGWEEARMDVTLCPADDPRVVDGYPIGYPDTAVPVAQDGEVLHIEMTQAALEELRAQHAEALATYNARPIPYRVSKDTVMSRVASHGYDKVVQLDDVLLQQPRAMQILWRDFGWFMSNNTNVIGLIRQIDLDPTEILARETF